MPTVRYVHPTLGPYITAQAAHDAADPGDTILLARGAFTHTPLYVTKRVHVRGDTEDPINQPVTIAGPNASTYPITFYLPSGSGELFIEGVTFGSNTTGSTYNAGPGAFAAGLRLRVNRCVVPGNRYLGYWFGNYAVSAIIENLTSRSAYLGNILYLTSRTDHQITLDKADLTVAPAWGGANANDFAIYSQDYVTTPTAGYGAGYGEWYWPQYQGAAMGINGQIILPTGVDRSATQVRLYRAPGGVIENAPWAIRTPHPVNGEWRFDYLPTTHTYWVMTLPPSGYAPRLDGPFIPQV